MDCVMVTKRCFKCERHLPLTEFYRHPQMADGRLGKCKDCTKHDVATNYRGRREQYAAYERARFKRPERKKMVAEYQRRRRITHPDKYIARTAVANAVRDGRLVRPAACSLCGLPSDVEAHHHDYSKPLDVIWMCFVCHRERGHGQVVNHMTQSTMNDAVFHWLASYGGPATTAELWDELTLKGLRKPPQGMPQRLSELSQAMRELVVAGRIEERDRKWHVIPQRVKQEARLF